MEDESSVGERAVERDDVMGFSETELRFLRSGKFLVDVIIF